MVTFLPMPATLRFRFLSFIRFTKFKSGCFIVIFTFSNIIGLVLPIFKGAAQRLHKELKNYYTCIKGKERFQEIISNNNNQVFVIEFA